MRWCTAVQSAVAPMQKSPSPSTETAWRPILFSASAAPTESPGPEPNPPPPSLPRYANGFRNGQMSTGQPRFNKVKVTFSGSSKLPRNADATCRSVIVSPVDFTGAAGAADFHGDLTPGPSASASSSTNTSDVVAKNMSAGASD